MSEPHDHDDNEIGPEQPLEEGASDELDALAYESITHNGSLVPRSLLDFLR